MNEMMNKATKFYAPCRATYEGFLSTTRDAGVAENERNAAYAVLWFLGTGRALTGAERALSHATRGTVAAWFRRVLRAMERRAALRGSTAVVAADLDNTILAAAFGHASVADASVALCEHPYGARYTIAA